MKIKAPLLVAAFSLLLGSCAWWDRTTHSPGGGTSAKAVICKEKKCPVTVTVAACVVTVTPDVLGIPRTSKDVEIMWEIVKSPGVTFAPDNAIYFKPKSREAAEKQFRSPRLVGPTRFTWLDTNQYPGKYLYGVNVVDNGKTCPPHDPIIIDDM